jgi:hypothetical protein
MRPRIAGDGGEGGRAERDRAMAFRQAPAGNNRCTAHQHDQQSRAEREDDGVLVDELEGADIARSRIDEPGQDAEQSAAGKEFESQRHPARPLHPVRP